MGRGDWRRLFFLVGGEQTSAGSPDAATVDRVAAFFLAIAALGFEVLLLPTIRPE